MGYFIRSYPKRCPMSWHLQNQVDQNALEGFYKSVYETAVMRALVSFANDEGESCFPALNTLAQRSQCSQRTVKRVLKKFRERRWITVKATGRANHYRILPHGCVAPAAAPSHAHARARSAATEAYQKGQPVPSEGRQSPLRGDTETHDSYQELSLDTSHHLHLGERSTDVLLTPSPATVRTPLDDFVFEEEKEVTKGKGQRPATTDPEKHPQSLSKIETSPEAQDDDQEDEDETETIHPGMPSLEKVRAETKALLLPDSDGDHLYDYWLANGYLTGGKPVKDWKAVVRMWYRKEWFPSLQ
jgi:hypothetical protein